MKSEQKGCVPFPDTSPSGARLLQLHSLPHWPQGMIEPEDRKGLARPPLWGKATTKETAQSARLRGPYVHAPFV